ncbi:hypothetical protein WA026_012172 [Henosepilachna vigintioctopunctata]|uniref:Uncharacterized protein n=1 Tax=Henosepilachna vigintioctopunctata TaxID=420089 RepID=A0AAW1VCS0_9CUCU
MDLPLSVLVGRNNISLLSSFFDTAPPRQNEARYKKQTVKILITIINDPSYVQSKFTMLRKIEVVVILVIFSYCSASEPTLDNFQLGDFLEISENGFKSSHSARSNSVEDNVENYFKSHDVKIKFPGVGADVTVEGRKLDEDEVNLKLNLNAGSVEARKSKLKKIIGPILIVVLLKAMTLIPLALGILGFKTWNALQLSFVSFVIAIGMAVYNLCRKVVGDHVPPQIVAHNPWDSGHYAARSLDNSEAQKLAYSGHL